MATLYKYYQTIGGEEAWTPIQAHLSLDEIKPTFTTVLAVDTLMDETTPKEVRLKAKYLGPMYFDLDASNIEESIAGAKKLVKKLQALDLTAQDLLIYLSGKKGLHILVPEVCFMEKVQPTQGLVAIYKEMAFTLAVDTMDFRVYTARRGRQFRTCYNVRENGNYKVQITLAELENLTADSYAELCKAPRVVNGHNPQWRGKFALLFDQASQKIGKQKPKATKPTDPAILKQQLPIYKKLASGEVATDSGFNIIAMQLALYAREVAWNEEAFITSCEGIIQNHVSDGSRYNSPMRRERELRRMFCYLDENSGFEYSVSGIKSCMRAEPVAAEVDSDDADLSEDRDFGGVYKGSSVYMVSKGEDGDIPITNFIFTDVKLFRSVDTHSIVQIDLGIKIKGKTSHIQLTPTSFTGGTAIQNCVAPLGGSFSGTDIHARGVYQAMLREVSSEHYILDSEGINIFQISKSASEAKSQYMVWADREGVKGTDTPSGVNIVFQGYPDPRGLYKTDLLAAPRLDDLLSTQEGYNRTLECFKSLVRSHSPEVIGKMLGWAIAAFYAPIFHVKHRKFPLLHVYGPSGNGKTETTKGILRAFYHREEAAGTTPNSSTFALQQFMGGSASIPLFLDEYKPHKLSNEKLEQIRAIMRDAYNAKEVQRGGGNKNVKDNFNALSSVKLQAPLIFVAEAPETETAIVERSVMVSFRRLAGKQQVDCFRNAMQFYKDTEPLSSVGLEVANNIVQTNDITALLKKFEAALSWANNKFLPAADDWEKVASGEMTQEEMRVRAIMRPRTVFNSTICFFGLQVLKDILVDKFSKEVYEEHFDLIFKEMSRSCYIGMDALAAATLPEFVKVLCVFADMTKLPQTDMFALIEGVDYNLSELGGKEVLVIAAPQCYRKYRAYMRHSNSSPLYPSEESFQLAIREIPQYISMGTGTARLSAPTTILALDELYRAAVTQWNGKAINLNLTADKK